MVGMKQQSYWWWFESHNSPKLSPWLQSTLTKLNEKTNAMLKLIEEDADSFSQRAEMYYTKRPELINMVGDFYRAHRSLAEQFDQVKSDARARLVTALGSPFFTRLQSQKQAEVSDGHDYYSETFDHEELAESDVEDPVQEDESLSDEETQVEEISSEVDEKGKLMELREEIEKLEEENKILKDQMAQKDEEKKEVIRQLSLAVDVLKQENMKLRKIVVKDTPKKRNSLEFSKLFNWFSKLQIDSS